MAWGLSTVGLGSQLKRQQLSAFISGVKTITNTMLEVPYLWF